MCYVYSADIYLITRHEKGDCYWATGATRYTIGSDGLVSDFDFEYQGNETKR